MLHKEKNKALALLLIFLFCMSALGWAFITNIKNMLVDEAKSNLAKVTSNMVDNLTISVFTRLDTLNALSHITAIIEPGSLEAKIELIKHESELKNFAYVGIADTNGWAVISDGSRVFIGDRMYYQIALSGKPAMSDPINSRLRNAQIITQAIPVFDAQGQVVNIIFGSDAASNMTSQITNIHYSVEAHVTLTDDAGMIIAQSKQGEELEAQNLFDFLAEQNERIANNIPQTLAAGNIDTSLCNIYGRQYYLTYAPMQIQDTTWFVFVGVPAEVVLAPAKKIIAYTALLVLAIICTIGLGFAYIYNLRQKYITELKVSEYRYKIITEHTDNIVLDWNILHKTLYFSKSWANKFSHLPPADLANYSFPSVHSEDVDLVKNAVKELLLGIQPEEFEMRVFDKFKNFIWLNVHLTLLRDEDDNPCRVIGILVDITDKKLKELQIKTKAEHDALSKLYNRHTFEEKAQAEFAKAKAQGTPLAFLFIDIDDFRFFNNNFGHAFGDRVISFIGLNLIQLVSGIGFAGRIGGDEFMVCITDAASIEKIEQLTGELQSRLREGLHARESDPKIEVGSSIGIVTMPHTAEIYQELVEKADAAMYHVKAHDKGHYMRLK